MKIQATLLAFALALGISPGAKAQIAVAGSDGKQIRADDDPPGPRPDTISIIDLNHYPPSILATIDGPASMIGPPTAIAVAPDSSFALVTAAQKADPDGSAKIVPNDTGSVVDLEHPRQPKIIQTFRAGPGATGVAINSDGTLALVASTEDDTISAYSIRGKRLTLAGKIQLAPKARPTDVIIAPNGKEALAVERGGSKLEILSIDGTRVVDTGRSIYTGTEPYGAVITPDGRFAINTTHYGISSPGEAAKGGQDTGAVTVVDLTTHQLLSSTRVGDGPEHVALSPDGKYLVSVVGNKANLPRTDPRFNLVHGLMHVFQVDAGTLRKLATVDTGHWCQGATWSNDNHTILLQCAAEREIQVYRFDGMTVVQDPAATLTFFARPGAIATAKSR